jgi:hypothetical protein
MLHYLILDWVPKLNVLSINLNIINLGPFPDLYLFSHQVDSEMSGASGILSMDKIFNIGT